VCVCECVFERDWGNQEGRKDGFVLFCFVLFLGFFRREGRRYFLKAFLVKFYGRKLYICGLCSSVSSSICLCKVAYVPSR
jgi:hypothetical protein